MGSVKGGSQTIGYHYLFSLLFGLSRGPINELRMIKVGDQVAWDSHACGGGIQAIDKPELFGGEKKEGGVQGPFRLQLGAHDQVLPGAEAANVNSHAPLGGVVGAIFKALAQGPWGGTRTLPAIKATIGGLVSDMRGVTTLWFDGLISSMNPYPKEWKFRVRRYSAGWQDDSPWYVVKSVIFMAGGKVHAMNPAHMIYECLTNQSWGRGLPTTFLNENSFIYSANLFCDEGFGLCLAWLRKEDIDAFIQIVLDHVGAALYLDPETGEQTLKPIRNDYVWADLPVFAPGSGLVEITEDDSASQDTAINEVIGKGHDPITDQDFQLRVQNLAARYSNGANNSESKEYPGIPTRDLMTRVLQRDLRQYATGLKKFNVVLDRAGWKLRPGMVFRVQDTRRGIADITLRVGEIDDAEFKSGRIVVKAIQDVFSMPAVSFVTPVESSWEAPPSEAIPAASDTIIEAGYRDLLFRFARATMESLDDTETYVGTLAASPDPAMYQYKLATRVSGEPAYRDAGDFSFTGTATLTANITALQTTFVVANVKDITADNEGQAILIGAEVMALVDFDEATLTATVTRGCADTIPQAHALGDRLWTVDDDLAADVRDYTSGETVEALVLTRTRSDTLDPSEATVRTAILVGRQGRPYPPGNVKVDGTSAYLLTSVARAEPVLTWAHRDRIVQADQLVAHADASVGPEDGQTYTVRVFADDGVTVLRTEAGIVGATWTYDATMIVADGDPVKVYIELESSRDGLASWQHYRFLVWLKSGYGYGYGLNYGGA